MSLIGPVGAMAVLGAGAAALPGSGASWAFIFAIVGVSLVAYGFIKLSQYVAHTGSVYALWGRPWIPTVSPLCDAYGDRRPYVYTQMNQLTAEFGSTAYPRLVARRMAT